MSKELKRRGQKLQQSLNETNNIKNGKVDSLVLAEKQFENRDSLLTELLKITHFSSLLNMFFAFMVLMLLNIISMDWINHGFLDHFHHLEWVADQFDKLNYVVPTLMAMYTVCSLMFCLTKSWINSRLSRPKTVFVGLYFTIYLTLIVCLCAIPTFAAYHIRFPPCSAAFIVYEHIRLMMKMHAFVKTVSATVFKSKSTELSTIIKNVNIRHFLYFMIAPTLVYRDSYPKRASVSCRYVFSCLVQFILCIVFIYYIFISFMRDNFSQFQSSFRDPAIFFPIFFRTMLPTVLMMLTMFYCVLHLWLNMFAELTRFGDRLFYKDWWNASSMPDYYRTWNVLVHDWLYGYIYTDIATAIYNFTGSKRAAKATGSVLVILVSAAAHEYVLAYCFRCFYPVLLVVYFFTGSMLYFLQVERGSRVSNIGLWLSLYVGNTIFMTLYSCEWYARQNCPQTIDGYLDFVLPRSWNCLV